MRLRLPLLFASAATIVACGRAALPLPFTAQDMAQTGSGRALAHYLTQPDATTTVCSRTAKGPHVGAMSGDDIDDFVEGLVDETVPPAVWQQCATILLATAPTPDESATFLDTMGR